MLYIILMIVTATIFYFGFLLGYKVANKEEIQPKINKERIKEKIPFTEEYKEAKEEEARINALNQLLENVNNYKGNDEGQRRIR
ncbi:MAG: hypothetical protein IKF17_05740 [Clostridia bacterium]|nr:hypothetical protein [Clostridia bacterium]